MLCDFTCSDLDVVSMSELMMYSIEDTPSNVTSEVVQPSAEAEPAEEEAEPADEEAETCDAGEAMPDLLSTDDNLLCVTIGGQSISINTKPSNRASAEVSAENSPQGSPVPDKRSLQAEVSAEVSEETADASVEEVGKDSTVMDLLADFSSPMNAELIQEEPPAVNSDIMDLLGGLEEPPPLSPSTQGTCGKLTVVG